MDKTNNRVLLKTVDLTVTLWQQPLEEVLRKECPDLFHQQQPIIDDELTSVSTHQDATIAIHFSRLLDNTSLPDDLPSNMEAILVRQAHRILCANGQWKSERVYQVKDIMNISADFFPSPLLRPRLSWFGYLANTFPTFIKTGQSSSKEGKIGSSNGTSRLFAQSW